MHGKRYFIITYIAAYDKVHYPLPLPQCDNPSKELLLGVIHRLRHQLFNSEPARKSENSLRSCSKCIEHQNIISNLRAKLAAKVETKCAQVQANLRIPSNRLPRRNNMRSVRSQQRYHCRTFHSLSDSGNQQRNNAHYRFGRFNSRSKQRKPGQRKLPSKTSSFSSSSTVSSRVGNRYRRLVGANLSQSLTRSTAVSLFEYLQ